MIPCLIKVVNKFDYSRAFILHSIYVCTELTVDNCVLLQALKEWRVVATYSENQDDDTNVGAAGIAEIQVDNLDCRARPLEFNPNRHKILISEFKYLYTALTRARVNVWLFDESEEARAPMFEYFQKRGVVDVKQVHKSDDNMASPEGMFAQKSDKDQWKKQGHFFYGKRLWKFASKCFAMADEEMWVKNCDAYEQAAKAASLMSEPRKSRLEFAKAAELFLQCNMKDEAEKCLFNARDRTFLGQTHEKSNSVSKQSRIYVCVQLLSAILFELRHLLLIFTSSDRSEHFVVLITF